MLEESRLVLNNMCTANYIKPQKLTDHQFIRVLHLVTKIELRQFK